MDNIAERIQARLFELQDLQYREFQCKLMPTVDPETVVGVRTPELRALAKELARNPRSVEFMKLLPHKYYEENNLHGFLIEKIKDFDEAIAAIDAFLPYVDNWATCDLMSPKALGRKLPELEKKIREWTSSELVYTVRFGVGLLMSFFLDEHFSPEYPELAAGVRCGEYYVDMMVAWYFATALAKQYDAVLPYLQSRRLDPWVHNKTIQKAIESYRVTDEHKAYLRTLKIKAYK